MQIVPEKYLVAVANLFKTVVYPLVLVDVWEDDSVVEGNFNISVVNGVA